MRFYIIKTQHLLIVWLATAVFTGSVKAQSNNAIVDGDNRETNTETTRVEIANAADRADADESDADAMFTRHNTLEGSIGGVWLVDALSAPEETFRLQLAIGLSPSTEEMHAATQSDERETLFLLDTGLSVSWTMNSFMELYGKLGSTQFKKQQIGIELSQDRREALLGLKSFYSITPVWSIGADLRFLLLGPVDEVGFDLKATSVGFRGSTRFDFGHFVPKFPLLARFNLDYFLDNSAQLVERVESQRFSSLEDASEEASREYRHLITPLERFALGINRLDLVSIGLGLELPLRVVSDFYLSPLVEWRLGFPVNRQGSACPFVPFVGPTEAGYENCLGKVGSEAFPHRLGLGLRIVPNVKGVALLLAADIGLNSASTLVRELRPARPYELIFALAYGYDPHPPVPIVIQEVVQKREPEINRYVRGIVVDQATGAPIVNATVHYSKGMYTDQATSEAGRFTSYSLEPGEVAFEIRHPDYRRGSCFVTIPSEPTVDDGSPRGHKGAHSSGKPEQTKARSDTEIFVDLRCELEAIARLGSISGLVIDTDGMPIADAPIEISGPVERSSVSDEKGLFRMEDIPEGLYEARVVMDSHYVRSQRLVVNFAKTALIELRMVRRPDEPQVTVTQDEIELQQNIRFERKQDTITRSSIPLLHEIADAFIRRPRITRVEIQAHTDNRGDPEDNRELSQDRAEAIRDWLIQAGIEPERLEAKGYGDTKPLVPNRTRSNRRRNNRVQFVILERDESLPHDLEPSHTSREW